MPMSPRGYDSVKRRAAAARTRERILEAARALVGGKGDLGDFSIDAVARRAGVARMTVYYQFRSRAGLLEALADHLAGRGGMERMGQAFAAPTRDEGIRRLVEVFVGFWATDRITMRRLRAMGVVLPSTASGPRDRDEWRRSAVARLLSRHARRGGAGRGEASSELVDTICALTSFEMYDLLRTGTRRTEEVADIVADLAIAAARRAAHDAG